MTANRFRVTRDIKIKISYSSLCPSQIFSSFNCVVFYFGGGACALHHLNYALADFQTNINSFRPAGDGEGLATLSALISPTPWQAIILDGTQKKNPHTQTHRAYVWKSPGLPENHHRTIIKIKPVGSCIAEHSTKSSIKKGVVYLEAH